MSTFGWMLREEWRSQSRRFGSTRFAVFPAVIAAAAAGAYWFVTIGPRSAADVAVALHAITFLFGLHMGTIAFVGRDALANLFGDRTLLVFSARVLPIRRARLFATFLVKDFVYYAGLYVAPLVLGLVPFWLAEGRPVGGLLLLWGTTVGSFALGAAATVAGVGAYTRGRAVVLTVAATAGLAIALAGDALVAYTPLAVYRAPSPASTLRALVPIAALLAAGVWAFRPAALSTRRRRRDRYRAVRSRLPDPTGLVTWTLFDLGRSSGSVWTVGITLGVVYLVAAFLVGQVEALVGVRPSPGITFGALLGLGSFGTYSWLTGFDDARTYLLYPLDLSDVFAAKFRAYLLTTIPFGLAYLALAAATFGTGSVLPGVLVFPGVAIAIFGLTAFLAGLSPNEVLFDTPRFVRYGSGMIVLAVPLLVAALAHRQAPLAIDVGAVAYAWLGALAGWALLRRAGPRWDARVRDPNG
jgi:hypothetical protein